MLLFDDMARLDMSLQGWNPLCRIAWENEYEYSQIDRFAEIGGSNHAIRRCKKTTNIDCAPQMKSFWRRWET